MPRALDGAKIAMAPAMYDAIADGMKGNANPILAALTTQSDTAKLRIVRHRDNHDVYHKDDGDWNCRLACSNASADNNFLDLIFNFTALARGWANDHGRIDYSPDGKTWTTLFYILNRMNGIDEIHSYWFEIKVSF